MHWTALFWALFALPACTWGQSSSTEATSSTTESTMAPETTRFTTDSTTATTITSTFGSTDTTTTTTTEKPTCPKCPTLGEDCHYYEFAYIKSRSCCRENNCQVFRCANPTFSQFWGFRSRKWQCLRFCYFRG